MFELGSSLREAATSTPASTTGASPLPPRRLLPRRARRCGVAVAPAGAAAGVAVAAVAVGIGVWRLGGSGGGHAVTTAVARSSPAPAPVHHTAASTARRAQPRPAVLVLRAVRGDCWLWVRVGSRDGATVYRRTLRQGGTLRLGLHRPLWVRVGAPWNLETAVGRRGVTPDLPRAIGDLVATASGLRPSM